MGKSLINGIGRICETLRKVEYFGSTVTSWAFVVLYAVIAGFWLLLYAHFSYRGDNLFLWAQIFMFLLFLPALSKFTLQLLVAPWHPFVARRYRSADLARLRRSTVSVIVPAWNEEVGVLSTVRSLLLSKHRPIEIIVVNDGSTDGTDFAMRDFLAGWNAVNSDSRISLRYISMERNGGKARAVNAGIRAASGEFVVTIDADSAVLPDTVSRIIEPFADPKTMSVAGNVRIGNRKQAIGVFQLMEYLYGFYFKQADALLESVYIVGGAAAAYRRSVFDEVGLFDEHNITEDIEMSTRIQAAGFRVGYAPRSLVYTEGPSDFFGLCRQRLRWKYGRFLTFWKYRRLFFSFRREHRRFLTLVTLPVALLSEVMLFFQWAFLAISISLIVMSGQWMPFVAYNLVFSFVVLLQIATDVRKRDVFRLLPIVPFAWLIFLFIDVVEYQALLRSLSRIARGRGVSWQKWKRVGVFGSDASQEAAA